MKISGLLGSAFHSIRHTLGQLGVVVIDWERDTKDWIETVCLRNPALRDAGVFSLHGLLGQGVSLYRSIPRAVHSRGYGCV